MRRRVKVRSDRGLEPKLGNLERTTALVHQPGLLLGEEQSDLGGGLGENPVPVGKPEAWQLAGNLWVRTTSCSMDEWAGEA